MTVYLSLIISNTSSPITIVCTVCLLYVVSLSIYRLYFHPLSHFPGPWFAKVSGLHGLYHAWKGDRHLIQRMYHERLGGFVRLGPNYLSINTNTGLKEIYGTKANVQKSSFYHAFVAHKGGWSTFTCVDKTLHARKRRALAPAFTEVALKSMEDRINRCINTFCVQIGSNPDPKTGWTGAVNISDLANYVAYDILGELAFGRDSFNMLKSDKSRYIIDLIAATAYWSLMSGSFPLLRTLPLGKLIFPNLSDKRQTYINLCNEKANQRIQIGPNIKEKDLFHYLISSDSDQEEDHFSMPELWAECRMLVVAGSDTTATALAATLYYLVHDSRVLQKLETEILSTFPSNSNNPSTIGFPSPRKDQCPYLRACIDEALRLSPPVTGTLPREVLPGGMILEGHFLPAGTVIGTGIYAIHHNPEYFPQPFAFRPERWIPGSQPGVTEESVALARSAFCPFSLGPRGCIGKSLAYGDLSTILARVLCMYRVRLHPGSTLGDAGVTSAAWSSGCNEYRIDDRFNAARDGPIVEFQSRGRGASVVGLE